MTHQKSFASLKCHVVTVVVAVVEAFLFLPVVVAYRASAASFPGASCLPEVVASSQAASFLLEVEALVLLFPFPVPLVLDLVI